MQRVIFFFLARARKPQTPACTAAASLFLTLRTRTAVSRACDSQQRVTLRRNSGAATPPGMHRVRRAKDAGKAPSASPSRTSDSLSFNGRYAPFARANSGVTATTSLGCRFCILRHRRPLRQLWSVARKSSGSRVSARAYRAECACSYRTNGSKGRVRTAVQGGRGLSSLARAGTGSARGSRGVRIPITGGPRTLISSCLCPPSVGSKDGRHCPLSFPPCVTCVWWAQLSRAGCSRRSSPLISGWSPLRTRLPPHPDTWGRGWRQQVGSSKVIPGLVVFETSLSYTSQKPKPSPTNQ